MTVVNNYANKCGRTLNVSNAMKGPPHAPLWTVEIKCLFKSACAAIFYLMLSVI